MIKNTRARSVLMAYRLSTPSPPRLLTLRHQPRRGHPPQTHEYYSPFFFTTSRVVLKVGHGWRRHLSAEVESPSQYCGLCTITSRWLFEKDNVTHIAAHGGSGANSSRYSQR